MDFQNQRQYKLFAALELPQSLKETLLADRPDFPFGHWTEYQHLHLTVAFIGFVDKERLGKLVAAFGGAFGNIPEIRMTYDGFGFFPRNANPRSFHLKLIVSRELGVLKERVDSLLSRTIDMQPEARHFRPHVTIFRIGAGFTREARTKLLQWAAARQLAPAPATTLTLFHSHQANGILQHEPLVSASLGYQCGRQ